MRELRWLLITHHSLLITRLIQVLAAAVALSSLVVPSLPPHSYSKDLQAEYLTARALRDGADPFAPLDELSARYFPVATSNLPHASNHLPAMALLGVPLTFLPFEGLVVAWLVANIALVVVVGRWLGLSLPGSLALMAWPPLWWVLFIGQYELALLTLAMLGWRAADGGQPWRSGAWLGLAMVIKFYTAFLLVPFLFRREFRVVLAAGGVFALAQVASLLAVGLDGLARYYGVILPEVAGRYVVLGLNSSPHGSLLRLLGGAMDVRPLFEAPAAVGPLTLALSLAGIVALIRFPPLAAPIAYLVASPAVWGYQAVLALPGMVALLRRPAARAAALVAVGAASFSLPMVNGLVTTLGRWDVVVPSGAIGLLAAVQAAGYIGLLLLWWFRGVRSPSHAR